jgi:DNA repair photolyase
MREKRVRIKVRKIKCKSALVPSKLPGIDFALNPYRGCEHACIYCYAPSVLRESSWGEWVDIKMNVAEVLSEEVERGKRGTIGIGTVTDAYQPVEKATKLTRRCIEELLKNDLPITIQTKSSLVLRDLDLIKKFSSRDLGFTITTLDDEVRKLYEPNSSSIKERMEALEIFRRNGVETWAFIGPILPFITDREMEKMIEILSRRVDYIMADRLNLKPGVWGKILGFLFSFNPSLVPEYKEILFSQNDYWERIREKMESICRKHKVDFLPLF